MDTEQLPEILFFTGKGGVGKTSAACATAIALVDRGRKVLLVSTDPASNLDEVLGVALGPQPRPVPEVPGLSALNIDPEAAARAYRERVVGPYRGVLPAAALHSIEEQLSGACTVEIAAFDQFAKLLGEPAARAGFDHVIFDTAPTGHTLRLLELPAAWTGFFDENTTGTSCLGPLSGLDAERHTYATALTALRDAARTQVILVARPEGSSLREAARAAHELALLGVVRQALWLNGLIDETASEDHIARQLIAAQRAALDALPEALADLPQRRFVLMTRAPMGVAGLRALWAGEAPPAAAEPVVALPALWSMEALIEALAERGHGVILTMGKGGVGKTTVAAQIARALAARGHRVQLTTTDPAAHVSEHARSEGLLSVSRIDPVAETASYSAHVMETAGASLDEAGRALLAEDLRSPCTEEIAVFQAFARVVAQGEDGFVVIDTAPTGHTLLLMDAAEAYHREVLRRPGAAPAAVSALLPRLRDADFARVLLVTLAEATPVHEARALQGELERAGIHPFGWVINRALTGHALTHPQLAARQLAEARFIEEVAGLTTRPTLQPWTAELVR